MSIIFIKKDTMKYLLLLLLLLLFMLSLSASAQPIFSDDMLWSTIHENYSDDYSRTSYYTKIEGDTVISEKQYRMVLNSDDSLMVKWSLAGFLREEGQKVFYRTKEDDADCLLYDFGCSVGDTLNLNCWCPESETYFKVDSIKTVPVLGVNRKHIYMSYLSNSSTLIWIEGIGSMDGFLNSGGPGNCMTGFHEKLLCCFKNDEKIYETPGLGCFLGSDNSNSVVDNQIDDQLFKIYPNPASSEINLQLNKNYISSYTCKIISINGTVIKTFKIENNTNHIIDTRNMKPGIYYVNLSSGEKIKTEKIIIKGKIK
jgi:hypothetical protein